MNKKVVVFSAHPDDETLGVGGTLLKHRSQGDELHWVIATKVSVKGGFSELRVESRKKEISQVADMFRFESVHKLEFDTMTLNGSILPNMITKISTILSDLKPTTIYVVNRSDAHSDHRVLFDAVMACTKSFRYPFIREVLMYECISETEFAPQLAENMFIPNYFVDISDYFEKKLEIMKVFSSEMGEHPFPRSEKNIEALAIYRGATAGVKYAEAFQVIKQLKIETV